MFLGVHFELNFVSVLTVIFFFFLLAVDLGDWLLSKEGPQVGAHHPAREARVLRPAGMTCVTEYLTAFENFVWGVIIYACEL